MLGMRSGCKMQYKVKGSSIIPTTRVRRIVVDV